MDWNVIKKEPRGFAHYLSLYPVKITSSPKVLEGISNIWFIILVTKRAIYPIITKDEPQL